MGTVVPIPVITRSITPSGEVSSPTEDWQYVHDNGFQAFTIRVGNRAQTAWIAASSEQYYGISYVNGNYYQLYNTINSGYRYIAYSYGSSYSLSVNSVTPSSQSSEPSLVAGVISPPPGMEPFNSNEELKAVLFNNIYPITYRLTNCTAPSAPTEAIVGYDVNVILQFTAGYGVVNPTSDVYVTNNGVVIPSTYSNGVLTFTMPDPSQ